MSYKGLLLLPVYRYAYIGMVANAYSNELSLGGVDYSVWEVVISTIAYVSLCILYSHRIMVWWFVAGSSVLLWFILRYIEYCALVRAVHGRVCIRALLCFIPGYLLVKAHRLETGGIVS